MKKRLNRTTFNTSILNTSLVGLLVTGALLVTGCSADKADFSKAAEKTIKELLEAATEGKATAECSDPGSTDIGTTFDCTGTAADGSTAVFVAQITADDKVVVTQQQRRVPGDDTSATLPTEDTVGATPPTGDSVAVVDSLPGS